MAGLDVHAVLAHAGLAVDQVARQQARELRIEPGLAQPDQALP